MTDQQTRPRAVVSGASIAGLSTAFWLRRAGWDVIVLERAPRFRDGGQNVDVRGLAKDVLERMGLLDAVRAATTTETGTVVVDADGAVRATLPSDGPEGATAELEVLRGDLARIVLDAVQDVEVVYADTVADVQEHATGVSIATTAGRRLEADVLVVAEGARSTTRDRLFPAASIHRRDLGITMAVGTIPRTASDDRTWRWFNAIGGRSVHLRPDNHGTTRAILAYAPGEDLLGVDRAEALARVRARYAGVGWQAPRVLDAFENADDLYFDQLTQIRVDRWHRGRVALVGDAAWCVTLMGGGGASLALIGGYALAAALAAPTAAADPAAAFAAYEQWMRPLADRVGRTPRALVRFAYPRTRLGLAARGVADRLVTATILRTLVQRLHAGRRDDARIALPAL
ncbi:FAD-dependent monooxygenase [Rathayibacter sp. VKM Ac-2835]|uniref:FAD-dependent monooxygenase n=1 Tax=Rathayibacter sp. VKM Ac-2835 TaxID=2739043 RepID=UPI00156352F2|nr:FAD-dependent monooxygenase [Rathayibacter sp. VKM Ac-2835]NRG42334.1 FAD-dependent monooxygenase [Rathayibacter sp. VKM Ac-2835]